MECPGDAFHSFLDFDSGIYLAVDGTVTSLPALSKISYIVFRTRTKLLRSWSDMQVSE